MNTHAPDNFSPAELPCAKCGYDLRMQPREGICPECATPVAESARIAALPHKPPWSQSDPRWRRRVLGGLYVLLLTPLPGFLSAFGPPYDPYGPYTLTDAMRDYNDSSAPMIAPAVVFSVGAALIFAPERGARPRRLDKLRHFGVAGAYLLLLGWAASIAGVTMIVLTGIDAFLNPPGNPALLKFARGFGRAASDRAFYGTLVAAVGVAVLLGLVLRDALRRAGSRKLALVMMRAGAVILLIHLMLTTASILGAKWAENVAYWEPFFNVQAFGGGLGEYWQRLVGGTVHYRFGNPHTIPPLPARGDWSSWARVLFGFPVEAAKWLLLLAVAVRLTGAQLAGRRRGATRERDGPS